VTEEEIKEAEEWEKYVTAYAFAQRFGGSCSGGGLDIEAELKKGSAHFDQIVPVYVKGRQVNEFTGERLGDKIFKVPLRTAIEARIKRQWGRPELETRNTNCAEVSLIALFCIALVGIFLGCIL